ncbi:MAG: secretion activating protein [Cyanobacteria bacterium M5B4]|nr:MAG: secretion activating protein [Cyanobacteria bacterium M5B4]
MSQQRINFQNVIAFYKKYTHQDKALNILADSLTPEQIANFYKYWYGDVDRADNVPRLSNPSYFTLAYTFTEEYEGGYVNHPNDPGGATNYGITQDTYNYWRQSKQLPVQHVAHISREEVLNIYYDNYWILGQCDKLGLPLNIVHFDTCVNFGVFGGITFLQEAVGEVEDGILGQRTYKAIKQYSARELAKKVCFARIHYRHYRVQQSPSQNVFLQGWLNRDNALINYIDRICTSYPCN